MQKMKLLLGKLLCVQGIFLAECENAFKIGGLIDLVMDNGDVVTKWVGGNG